MTSVLLVVGLAVAVFVGFNIGGSSTGVAFGPAVGSRTVSKVGAAALMTVFALVGGWTVGRRVIDTLSDDLVSGDPFTLQAGVVVLLFIGVALFLANLFGVPASTSMTTVGAIGGYGLATGRLNHVVVLGIISWWVVAPIAGFWVSGVVGRYWYDAIDDWIAIERSEGPLLVLGDGSVPRLETGPDTTRREVVGTALVVAIACFMAFSAGASNVGNAVAPLVGSGDLGVNDSILLASAAIGLGAFTIARRTLDTMGDELTSLPLTAALVVAVVSATLVTFLSAIKIPASFVVIATMSTVGLGWGRATRVSDRSVPEAPDRSTSEALISSDTPPSADKAVPDVTELYRPATTARVILLQNLVPGIATVAAYLVFRFVPAVA